MIRVIAVCVVLSGSAQAGVISMWQGDSAESQPGMHASLTPDGPWLAKPSEAGGNLEVHDTSHARPRFRSYADGVTLLLYAEPEKLATVTLPGADLVPNVEMLDGPFTAQTPGVQLPPGEILDAEPDDHGHRKASWIVKWGAGNSFEVHGFVQTDHLGRVYRSAMIGLGKYTPDVTLPATYRLLDKPKGTAFVFSKTAKRVEAMTLAKKSGFTLVRVGQGAVGWIASAQVNRLAPAKGEGEAGGVEGGVEGGVVGGVVDEAPPALPVHTVVYDAIDGTPVGEVTDLFTGKQVRGDKGWLQFELASPFGPVAVWAKKR